MNPTSTKAGNEDLLAEAADAFTQQLARGEPPDIEAYAQRYPRIAAEIRQIFPALQLIHTGGLDNPDAAWPSPDQRTAPGAGPEGQLGDYRIIREIGRGGMGVVYEAEQLSLKRRVALKVLPFAAVLDQKQLQRFRNEAQAAAHLHHTHIVPVFAVGCERGVHYYAMQYIEGHPLSAVIAELRRLCGVKDHEESTAESAGAWSGSLLFDSTRNVAASHAATQSLSADDTGVRSEPSIEQAARKATADERTGRGSAAHLGVSAESSHRGRSFFRSVAQIAIQAAEALQHAHDQGIIHRDVKPSNLLLDVHGNIWVTDFGLALVQSDATLTMPGDLVGTIRYMSPEQALARRVPIDHRTDIYSLGVTLYELLTLEPVFRGCDRQELLRQIAFEDPVSPRKLCPGLPRELETILGKATAKRPDERYATAQDLADDLRRFLEDKPILARPPTVLDRAAKWARRHRPIVAAAAVLLVMAVIGLSVSNVLIARARNRMQEALQREGRAVLEARAKAEEAARNAEAAAINLAKAVSSEATAREALYAARINLIQQAIEGGDIERSLELLNSLRPDPDQEDLRGFEWFHLWRLCHEDRLALHEFTADVRAAVYSPDGRLLATPHGMEVKLWDAATGEPAGVLPAGQSPIRALAFSPDGRLLAVVGGNRAEKPGVRGEIKLWDVARRQPTVVFPELDEPATAVAFSPDGKLLVVGTAALVVGYNSPWDRDVAVQIGNRPGRVRLWSVDTGREVDVLEGETESILSAAFSPDGAFVAAGSTDAKVLVWEAASGKRTSQLSVGSFVLGVAFNRKGSILAAAWGNWREPGEVALWCFPSLEPLPPLRGHQAGVTSVAFSPEGGSLATASYDRTVRLWSPPRHNDNRGRWSAPEMLRILRGHRHFVYSVVFAPDGGALATSGKDNTVRLWDVSNPLAGTRIVPPSVGPIALFPDGRVAAASGESIHILDRDTGAIRSVFTHPRNRIAVSPDGRWIAAADDEKRLLDVWDAITGERHREFTTGPDLWHVDFSPDGRAVVTAGGDDQVVFHDLQTGRVMRALKPQGHRVRCFAFSPDGLSLATATWEGAASVQIWDLRSGEAHRLQGRGGNALAYSRDGRYLAVGRGGRLELYDARTDRQHYGVRAHPEEIWNVAFAPDGRTVATQGWDGSVRLWSVRTGELLLSFPTPGPVLYTAGLAFTRDGSTLAAGNVRGVQVWEAASREEADGCIDAVIHRFEALRRLGRLEEAEAFVRTALERYRRELPEVHARTARVMVKLGSLLLQRRNPQWYPEAEALITQGRRILGRKLVPGHPWRWEALYAARDLYGPDGLNHRAMYAQIAAAIGYQPEQQTSEAETDIAARPQSRPSADNAGAGPSKTNAVSAGSVIPNILLWSKESPEGVSRAVQAASDADLSSGSFPPLQQLIYAEHLILGGDMQPAAEAISQAIDRAATKGDGVPHYFYKSLGWALLGAGEREKADLAFRAALNGLEGWSTAPAQADPDQWVAAYFLDLTTAEQFVSRWREDTRFHQRFACLPWFYIGQRREIEGHLAEALAAYHKCVELGRLPNAHHVSNWAAYRLSRLTKTGVGSLHPSEATSEAPPTE